jgi:glycine dehydrogenase subunit 1
MNRFAYLPHTPGDIDHMLDAIGVQSIEELFADIPEVLRTKGTPNIPNGLTESEVYREVQRMRDSGRKFVSFLGAGCYDHLIPSTVPFVTGRTEFATSYTPYQAEASQGSLQAMFEFQTMIALLTGLPVPNASLYDGSTAAAEACAMALQTRKRSRVIAISKTVHPHTIQILRTYFSGLDVELVFIPESAGETDWNALKEIIGENLVCVLAQSPNRYGIVEDLTGIAALIHDAGALLIVSANPMTLGILKTQAEWGADIAVGDGQPFGLGQNFGGPSVGYIAATNELMRHMPGRIVGETADKEGRRAFVLTLQTREQHIRRERATSNICTNQALAALAVAAYLATVGKEGLREIAKQNVQKAHYLAERIRLETPATLRYQKPFFNEFVIDPGCSAQRVVEAFLEEGFFAGVPLCDLGDEDSNGILVAVTEKRTRNELDRYVEILRKVLL